MEAATTETGQASVAFYGSSSGALRAAAFAEAHPDAVSKLVLDAFVWTGKGSPTLAERAKKLDQWKASNMRAVDRAFFHSIFNRDMPGTSEDGVADALADAELALVDAVPTGTYYDMCVNLPVNDPTRLRCPVLIIRGEHDGIATEDDLLAYYRQLPNKDKQFVVVPGQAHVSYLGVNRARFWHVLRNFLEGPPRIDSAAA
jgi:pimeloyl-ACP methyl ester carboxylesterase